MTPLCRSGLKVNDLQDKKVNLTETIEKIPQKFQAILKKTSQKLQKSINKTNKIPQKNSKSLQSSESFKNSTDLGDKSSENSKKTEEIVTKINEASARTKALSRKSDKTTQISTETNAMQSSIDVSSSTQLSLEIVQGIDNSREGNNEISTELILGGDDKALENLRRLNEISRNLRM
ncbi:hypothetical protein ACKWTF_009506 [Chironomus riparius]